MEKKKYIGVWEDKNTKRTHVQHILAEDINEAKIIMVYLMKLYGGDYYKAGDIKYISEEKDNYYVDYESALNKFRMNKRDIPYVSPFIDKM